MIKEISDFSYINTVSNYKITKNNFSFIKGLYVDDILVGFIDYVIMYEKAELNYIYILERYRSLGYSKRLLDYMINDCLIKSVDSITLEVSILNNIASELYVSYKFRKIAIRKGYYDGVDAILMIKELGD